MVVNFYTHSFYSRQLPSDDTLETFTTISLHKTYIYLNTRLVRIGKTSFKLNGINEQKTSPTLWVRRRKLKRFVSIVQKNYIWRYVKQFINKKNNYSISNSLDLSLVHLLQLIYNATIVGELNYKEFNYDECKRNSGSSYFISNKTKNKKKKCIFFICLYDRSKQFTFKLYDTGRRMQTSRKFLFFKIHLQSFNYDNSIFHYINRKHLDQLHTRGLSIRC